MPTPPPDGAGVAMTRPHLRDIPRFPLLPGYRIRAMDPGEGPVWVDIWRDAEPYVDITDGHWEKAFGYRPDEVPQRCFLVEAPSGEPIATGSAWMTEVDGLDFGQVHWVATRRAHGGRGIAKALMSHLLEVMGQWHEAAILYTQSKRHNAIHVYLEFGFQPRLQSPEDRAIWNQIAKELQHERLHALLE